MKICKCIFGLVSVFALLIGFVLYNNRIFDIFLPNDPDWTFRESWGLRNTNETDVTSIKIKVQLLMSDKINVLYFKVPEEILTLLKDRIVNRTSAPSFPKSKFKYGFNVEYHNTLMDYWSNDYQWRQWESKINEFPHFYTTIKGLRIHFIHLKPVPKPS